MADAGLIIQLLATQVQGLQNAGANRTATGVPPDLLSAAVGSFVTGIVISRDSKGSALLRTEKGDLTISSDIALKVGSEVVLRIEGNGESLKSAHRHGGWESAEHAAYEHCTGGADDRQGRRARSTRSASASTNDRRASETRKCVPVTTIAHTCCAAHACGNKRRFFNCDAGWTARTGRKRFRATKYTTSPIAAECDPCRANYSFAIGGSRTPNAKLTTASPCRAGWCQHSGATRRCWQCNTPGSCIYSRSIASQRTYCTRTSPRCCRLA